MQARTASRTNGLRPRVGDGAAAVEDAEVGDQGVRAVEQTELDQFVGFDLVADDRSGAIPGGSAGGEVVFEDPHREFLGGHRAAVVDAEQLADVGDGSAGGRGHDSVDHRVGERDVVANEGQHVLRSASSRAGTR